MQCLFPGFSDELPTAAALEMRIARLRKKLITAGATWYQSCLQPRLYALLQYIDWLINSIEECVRISRFLSTAI